MAEIIRVYNPDEDAYNRLERCATVLTAMSPTGKKYYVADTYFDFGQNWMYTCVSYDDPNWGGVQALNPRDYEKVLTYDNLSEAIFEIITDKYWRW